MAVKFSQFVVETDKANVNYLVGWDGTENVQITPADLLGSYPSGSGAAGQVTFFSATSTVTGDNNLYWDNTNKRLGIGTTSPTKELDVRDEARIWNGVNGIELSYSTANTSGIVASTNTSGNLEFRTNVGAAAKMFITNAGNVGIGTSSPSAKLDVQGTLIATGVSQLGSGGSNVLLTSSSAGNVGIGDSGPTAKLVVDNVGTKMLELKRSGNIKFRALADANHAQLDMFNSSLTKNISLHSNSDSYFNGGNVGIGTSSPGQKLEVAGRIRVTTDPTIEFYEASNKRGGIQWDITNDYTNIFAVGGDIRFDAGAERMRITSAGNVGIGTTSPQGDLHVVGKTGTAGRIYLSDKDEGTSGTDSLLVMKLDADAYCYNRDSGKLFLGTNNDSTHLTINSSGNVGIGTTNPLSKLNVESGVSDNVARFVSTDLTARIEITDSADASYFGTTNGITFLGPDDTSGGNNINITSAGNVGIGTSSPLANLTVTTSMSSSPTSTLYLDVEGTNTNGGGGQIVFNTSATSGSLTSYNAKITGTRVFGTGGDSELGFWTTLVSDNQAPQQRMVITKEGNVGINTVSPYSGTKTQICADDVSPSLNTPGIEDCTLVLSNSDDDYGTVFATDSSGNGFIQQRRVATLTYYNLNLQPYGGNVGIGTTSPSAALDVVGRIGLNDGNNNVSIGDLAGESFSTGDSNTALGYAAARLTTVGTDNVAIGLQALYSNVDGSASVAVGRNALYSQDPVSATNMYNVAVGHNAGLSVTTGTHNVLLGGLAGDALTTGSANIAIGYEALSTEDGHSQNVAIGYQALKTLNAGTAGLNVAVGHQAGTAMTTGTNNTLVGGLAGDALTTGFGNIALGYGALSVEQAGGRNVAIGWKALVDQNVGSDAYNVAVGYQAGLSMATGVENVLMGGNAALALTTGIRNVAIGHGALQNEDTTGYNVAIGNRALQSQNAASDAYNVAVGSNAGQSVTTGTENIIIGGLAGDALTTSSSNVAIGYLALSTEDTGGRNVAIGRSALFAQNYNGSAYNVAIGYSAGSSVSTGTNNTIIGGLAGDGLTTGSFNTVLGFGALGSEDEHGRNVAIGYLALTTQNAGSDAYNVAIGFNAGTSVTTGVQNTIIGGLAGDALTTGSDNVVVGYDAADNLLDGVQNTLVGDQVAGALTSGDENTYIGRRAASSATTGNQNVAIGAGASLSSATVSNEVNISNSSVIARFQGAASSWSFVSDARDKKDIEDLELGVEFINKLKPRKFKWDLRDSDVDKDKEASGFVAQEIQEILNETGINYSGIVDTNNPDQYTVAQSNIVPMLVKAIQELSAEVKELKSKI